VTKQEISKLRAGLSQAGMAAFIAPETDKQQTVVLETAQPEQDKFEPAAAAPPSDEPGLNELIKRTELFS
jgi:hypothetical protein